ncbi:E1 ubiquitin-activating protein UBA2 ASCRUDRAFT_33371 [Ascoidea rubescens DSM 1968]|uniref:Ubiquitin-activating enzyme E1-like n=1 Tax=Ascoidea rubescens DSM 1968 TaxID=1344418 RepID=A0A1D2VK63_9ASCO|nr:hypothetical protein ASCRUDRAFT_33371 [Ascoidea rubescens DSM 1968]ODV61979.1 hypothetical protein ASCRUDRAFT_33371 [Ascoidea rubescens DSM 1968]
MARDSYIQQIIGAEKYEQIKYAKVLLVGAGGIGCELLKDLILMGFGEIHIVDLDTIDLSNLNRQFLFRKKDIKKSKAFTAIKAVNKFKYDHTKLVPYMASIMDSDTFNLAWFDQFHLIFNALDNKDARSFINRICLFLKKPFIESGTTGFFGQVVPIFPYESECYDCTIKETPKSFPVCTIRSTPSQPVHCIHWAKNFLFAQLFGEINVSANNDVKTLGSDNKEEINTLINEQNELINLRNSIFDSNSSLEFALNIIKKIFIDDINKLLKIDDLWKTRKRPIPLDISLVKLLENDRKRVLLKQSNIDEILSNFQKLWSLNENLIVLIYSLINLRKRILNSNNPRSFIIDFDKDDEDTLNFAASSANIRSIIFDIPVKSKFDIKQIAGNIIPAIATTNAMMAGFSALQSLNNFNVLQHYLESKIVFTSIESKSMTNPSQLFPGSKTCASCTVLRELLKIKDIDNEKLTLRVLLKKILNNINYKKHFKDSTNEDDQDNNKPEISIVIGKNRLIYDIEFDDNLDRSLKSLGFKENQILTIKDDDDIKTEIELYILEDKTLSNDIYIPKIDNVPEKPKKKKPKVEPDTNPNEPITFDDEDDDENKKQDEDILEDTDDFITILDDGDEPDSSQLNNTMLQEDISAMNEKRKIEDHELDHQTKKIKIDLSLDD